jgi:hypothetical protein
MSGIQLPFPENSPSVVAVKHDLLYVILTVEAGLAQAV